MFVSLESNMSIFTEPMLVGLASLISSLSALIRSSAGNVHFDICSIPRIKPTGSGVTSLGLERTLS
jgi:hypothetical protein